MSQTATDFLKEKLSTTSWKTILRMEIESWSQTLCMPWPGIIGFALRSLLLSTLLKAKKGMAWIQPNVRFVHCERISMGRNCGINSGTYVNGLGGITMGDHVLIGSNVTISSGRHPIEGQTPPIFVRPCEPSGIIIEDDVWIGAGAVIMPGITLRKGTVVGANAVVTRSTEEYAIVVGAPARVIRYRAKL